MKIFSFIKEVFSFCSPQEVRKVYVLLLMMVIGAGLEVIGIGTLVPFIALLGDPQLVHSNETLSRIYEWWNIKSDNDFLFIIGVILLVVYVLKNAFAGLLIYFQSSFLYGKQARLARDLLSIYMHREYSFHLQRDGSELLRNIMTEAINVINGVMLPLLALATEGMVLLFILILLFSMAPMIALSVFLIIVIVSYTVLALQGKALARHGKSRAVYTGQMIKGVTEGLGGIKDSRLRGAEGFFVNAFYTSGLGYVHSAKVYAVLNALPRLVLETIAIGAMLLVVLLVLSRGDNTEEAATLLMLFAVSAVRLMPSINRMSVSINSMRFYYPALVFVRKEFAREHDAVLVKEDQIEGINFDKFIQLKDVAYRYSASGVDVLRNISLDINKGDSIAFVGSSGAGKSTLIDLILGLHVPTSGQISIDGVDLLTARRSWQKKVGYVPQSIFLLDGSIQQNVAFGLPDEEVDDDQVRKALIMARLEVKLSELPEGLDTEVGENGVRLSGGERQRIGIARALYHNPEILVFDEATSALDNKTEQEISATIKSLFGKMTVIMIAHRLSTIQDCNTIYFMDDGKIIVSGSYDELMRTCEAFREMASIQGSK